MHLSSTDYSQVSDADLDNAYASAYAAVQGSTGAVKVTYAQVLNDAAQEILNRIGGVWGFIQGALGTNRFPQYTTIQAANPSAGGFQQSAVAQTAIATSASKVAADVKTAFKWTLGGAMGLGVAALVALYLLRRK